jgi:sortase (surface protein transpeptidase)
MAPAGQGVAPAGQAGASVVEASTRGAAAAVVPVRVRLPSIGVDAPVVAVGVDARGEMEVPLDVRTAGWYRFGPAPGDAAGSSVLSGHVDDREQGPGAFYRLADLAPGDPVQVVAASGRALDFRVRDVRSLPKVGLPVDELFARDGPPRLTLVTCGGPFDRATRSYVDNVVVTALPA